MKLKFIGTRGYIEMSNPRHRMHTALLIEHRRHRTMIDCGEDWLGHIEEIAPHEIILTHAHPDHAFGLARGAPCPVYATEATWRILEAYPIEEKRTIVAREPFEIGAVRFDAFPLEHSTTSPAVGYRVSAGKHVFFYAPDVVYIEDREAALTGAQLYIGDGATVSVSFVRKQKGALIGHSPVQTQLTWCMKTGVPRAVITHCGKEIVGGDEAALLRKVQEQGAKRGVEVSFAYDGMELILR